MNHENLTVDGFHRLFGLFGDLFGGFLRLFGGLFGGFLFLFKGGVFLTSFVATTNSLVEALKLLGVACRNRTMDTPGIVVLVQFDLFVSASNLFLAALNFGGVPLRYRTSKADVVVVLPTGIHLFDAGKRGWG